MICPQCGAAAQPYDRFCIRCGHDMQPNSAGAAERGQATATNPSARTATPSAPTSPPPYAGGAYGNGVGAPPAPQPYNNGAPPQSGWASGSSTPGPNPFGGPRSTPSNGTMLNGRPANAGGKGLFQGVGAAIVALFVILGKFGGAIASIGFFKLWFIVWLLHGLGFLHNGAGALILIVLVLLIAGAFARSRGMV